MGIPLSFNPVQGYFSLKSVRSTPEFSILPIKLTITPDGIPPHVPPPAEELPARGLPKTADPNFIRSPMGFDPVRVKGAFANPAFIEPSTVPPRTIGILPIKPGTLTPAILPQSDNV